MKQIHTCQQQDVDVVVLGRERVALRRGRHIAPHVLAGAGAEGGALHGQPMLIRSVTPGRLRALAGACIWVPVFFRR